MKTDLQTNSENAQIQVFQNEQFGQIRTAVTDAGDPLFCLADVCKSLAISNARNVKTRLDNGDVRQMDTPTESGIQNMTFVTEPGMYTVILRSDSPKAKPMQKWVTSEVLPALRKTGGYMIAQANETPEQIMARALIVAQETLKRTEEEKARLAEQASILAEQNDLQQQELEKAAPKTQYYDDVLASKNVYNINRIAKELGMSAVTLNLKLRDNGVQYNQGGQWLLTAKYQNRGYCKTRTYTFMRNDGSTGTSLQTVWTEAGREFIHKLFKNE